MEGFIDLYESSDKSGNKPHYRGYLKINGERHEFALWPAKEGKKGYSGKYKPAKPRDEAPAESTPDSGYAPRSAPSSDIPF